MVALFFIFKESPYCFPRWLYQLTFPPIVHKIFLSYTYSPTFVTYCPLASSHSDRRRRQWQPTPVLMPGKSHGWRSLVGAVHEVAKSRTRLSDFTFTFHFHALEKEMATHSSLLARKIPGTGEPGRLLSMGSHRVGHN